MKAFRKISLLCLGFCLFTVPITAATIKITDYFTVPQEIALATAAASDNVPQIQKLAGMGTNINARGRSDLTPLMLAAINHNKQAYECLLKLGADPNIQFQETGSSAVLVAAAIADSSFLEQALVHGGKPNQVNPLTGLTPIWRSIEEILPTNVKLLAAAGADVNFPDGRGVTPLMFAAGSNRYDIDLILLDAGADPRQKNKWGNSLLWYIHHNRADPQSKFFEWKEEVVGRLRTLGIDTEHGS
jgi:ankyrin repeat protein